MNNDSLQTLELVFGGHIFFQTLRTAVRLGIFDLLAQEGPLTRRDMAERLGLAEQPLRIVLLGLVSTGILRKEGDLYANSEGASQYLTSTSPKKITAYVELQHRVMYKGLYWLLESVREYRNVGLKEFPGDEPTLYQRLSHDPELERIFQEAMQELSVQANQGLVENLDLQGVRHLVDVGGGDGTNLITLAKRFPELRGTVFDSPTVCEIARANIAAHGLSDRIDAVPGNCFSDPFPPADAYMFCHFFTIWSAEKDRAILQKCHDALPPGGRVILFNMMQNDSEDGPLSAAIGSPYFLAIATGEGMLYTWKEYEDWMRQAGFEEVQRQALPLDHGIITGIRA
ncbi:L-tyrosine C(3)-methyltransferase [Methylomarinovum tepidoasis]|uniref:L-tyrosine C(3)-methyltransferase n=1 Tax=Methylomarinovum tepidoasis TaxID=2840183 RepID=A0AAU9CEP7_9GAMM|nr:methyltransferase [Methylomarinovum sp. IN45]BCX88703.1 L-tyrosine C(3)-methyltransferase [Methylomarinovum sp. IN45]